MNKDKRAGEAAKLLLPNFMQRLGSLARRTALNKFVANVFMITTVEQELKDCISQLNEAEQQRILQMIKTFLLGRQQTADSVSIEEYNKELDEAEAEFERGEFITHEEMLKQVKQW